MRRLRRFVLFVAWFCDRTSLLATGDASTGRLDQRGENDELFRESGGIKNHDVPRDCERAFGTLKESGEYSLYDGIALALHRNGEPSYCDLTLPAFDALKRALRDINGCKLDALDKYSMETFMTTLFINLLGKDNDSCGSSDNATAPRGLEGFCDMSEARTVRQPDFDRLDRLPASGRLPCRFYTREGRRIDSLSRLTDLVRKARRLSTMSCDDHEGDQTCFASPALHLYAVPAGRFFMFAPSMIGERFLVDYIPNARPITVETMSLSPRVFELHDFYSEQEAADLIQEALSQTSETHKLHRSTTGASVGKVFARRTSDNAWVTETDLALRIKRRCLEFLGFDEFWASHTDGLQVLRYQNGQAYVPHEDYLTNDSNENYDYDSSGVGGNRYATILLYMSQVERGGETVFEKAWPAGATEEEKSKPIKETIRELRASGQIDLLQEGSWEESLAAKCRTRLVVAPKPGRAVLFYSQHPNGTVDKSSLHGACPVLEGTKWASNLWVWSAPRPEYPGAPRLRPNEAANPNPNEKLAIFTNTGRDPRLDKAELFWDKTASFGKFGPNDPPIRVNTFPGHKWHVMVDGESLYEFVISPSAKQEAFQV